MGTSASNMADQTLIDFLPTIFCLGHTSWRVTGLTKGMHIPKNTSHFHPHSPSTWKDPVSWIQSGGKLRVECNSGKGKCRSSNACWLDSEPWANSELEKLSLGFRREPRPRSAALHGNWENKEQTLSGGKGSQFRLMRPPISLPSKVNKQYSKANYSASHQKEKKQI